MFDLKLFLQALCRVTWQNPSVFQSVIEVVGLSVVCQALTQGITRVQQAVVTMFGSLVANGSHLNRLTQDKVGHAEAVQKIFLTTF